MHFALLLMLGGSYLLLLSLTPRISTFAGLTNTLQPTADATQGPSEDTGNKLIIEKIGLSLRYGPKESDLTEGSWNRYADRSNPEMGGNMVLAGHRFELGWTPQQTKARSPFYKINALQAGDKITIQFNGKSYDYKVTKQYTVESDDTWIEDNSEEHKLTIYSCVLGGSEKGRIVIEALPI
ncbi:MAG: sortase [bacterium]|nr:sortase [bacterium]